MTKTTPPPTERATMPTVNEWKQAIARFQEPNTARAVVQLVSTLVPLFGLWYLASLALERSIWLALPIAAVAGTLLVRCFIFFHDCGHGSFFKNRIANDVVGFVCGVLTFTPYYMWRWQHAQHHATSGDLDRRGTGDVWTMTVQEYLESSRWKRFAYRLSRNPVVLFVIAPVFLFVFLQRVPYSKAGPRERRSVWQMDAGIAVMILGMSAWLGFWNYAILQLTAMAVAGSGGVWLFYVQHQYEGAYWERADEWDYTRAALMGSSYYALPQPLRWLSGNIGFHHIHHLSPRIPNYHLEECHRSSPFFSQVEPMTLWASFRSARLHLWDEKVSKLISFRNLRRQLRSGSKDRARQAASKAASLN